jgi:hypothetical protein
MKKVIIISIIIGIIITGSVILLNSNQEIVVEEVVRETLGETVEDRWEREQITSGPFSIDKSQYNLGEKIFITVSDISENERGQMIFFRQGDSTMWKEYITIDYDGQQKNQFNLYFEPQLSKLKKICSTNDLVGSWIVKFIGTEYSDITFEMLNQTASWDTRIFEPIC